jgi:hypothetical protein
VYTTLNVFSVAKIILYKVTRTDTSTFKVDALVSVLVILYNIIFVTEKTFKVDALVSVLVISKDYII